MALSTGDRLGPYEVLAPIGAGGMGEVYRARDTKLGREVALKILPAAFATDRDRLMRFEREARTLATLNHAHIAQVYGLEEDRSSAGHEVRALVMELVDGDDLSAVIAHGPVPLDDALSIARQIAEALEAAHDLGIVHRDLKPANIKVRADGSVKVLDFGLAKVVSGEPGWSAGQGADEADNSPTITSPAMTAAGIVLGTAAYMSPEQARGKPVDKRADMWAFGCVLFEMLTGHRAFKGSSPTDVIAQIVTSDPDWSALPARLPANLTRLLRRCLEKNPQRRLRDAGDARLDLEEGASGDPVPRPAGYRSWIGIVAASIAAVAVAGAIGLSMGRGPREVVTVPVTRSTILLPSGQRFETGRRGVTISSDGTQILYTTSEGLHHRRLDAFESRLIPGTQNGINPVFSPDGHRIAMWTMTGIRIVDPATGGATTLRLPDANNGGILGSLSWDEHGLMLTQGPSGVFLFPGEATDARRIIELSRGEAVSSAQMLPGGEHVLMTLLQQAPLTPGSSTASVVVQPIKSGNRVSIAENGSDAHYVPSGHVVYVANGSLHAVSFDVATFRRTGEPTAVVEGVRTANIVNATTHYSVSNTGTLAYVPGQVLPPTLAMDLVAVQRNGSVRHLHLPPAPYESPRVSPDGTLVAVSTDDGKDASVWIHDLSTPSSIRKLTVGGRNRFPVWSPDGKRIAFQSNREGDVAIFAQAADGSDAPVRLTRAEPDATHTPESWSPSGSDLLFAVTKDRTNTLWRLSLRDQRTERLGNVTSPTLPAAAFAPGGRWVAYNTIVGSGHAVFVQPFPPTGAVYQISSNDDGHHAVWSRDGSELFYIPGPGRLFAVKVTTGGSFAVSAATTLPPAGLMGPGTFPRNIDILKDGTGLIGRQIAEDEGSRLGAPPRIHLVTNWFEELTRRGR